MCEPWWNPFAEDQATDRVHRIGPRYKVRVKHFLMRDSVEERIVQRARDKLFLMQVCAWHARARTHACLHVRIFSCAWHVHR